MSIKNKTYLSLFIFIVLSICLVLFLVCPLFRDIKTHSSEIISQQQSLISLGARAENLEKFRIKHQEIEADLEKIAELFIDSEMPVDFIRFLEKISRDSDAVTKISPALPTKIKDEPWPSLAFQITSASSPPNLLKFLEKLESSIHLIEIQNLSIARLTEADLRAEGYEKFSLEDVKANLLIKVYAK